MNAISIPENAGHIINELEKNGYEAYAVGGCVRDSILGRVPEDWDIATSATPQQVKSIFSRTYDTGIEHGTVTVLIEKTGYEVTTYRIDGGYRDNRHPTEVSFTDDLSEDLLRRDFTMNAIAYHPTRGWRDPFNGIGDINSGVIRGVGNPELRFKEDALRMLRAVRFSVQLGFEVEPVTMRALKSCSGLIKNISAERINQELVKLLCSSYTGKAPLLWESGLMAHILPDITDAGRICALLEKCPPDEKILRLAAFFSHMPEQRLKAALKQLRFDNASLRLICAAVSGAELPLPRSLPDMRRFMGGNGLENARNIIALKKIYGENVGGAEAMYSQIRNAGDCLTISGLALGGRDLAELGAESGPSMGAILSSLLNDVHNNPELNTKASLTRLALEKYIQ